MDDEELLENLIRYFDDDKFKFENFCKIVLNWLDFDEIMVTKGTGDGGVDLKAVKKDIEDVEIEPVHYLIQAKCKEQKNKIDPKTIRDFKGAKYDMSVRRIFITTSDYTKGAIEEANDQNKFVTLINGMQLIQFCKQTMEKMFDIKYYFNKDKLNDLFNADSNASENMGSKENEDIKQKIIEHKISKNDVIARILRIPSEYKDLLKLEKDYLLKINDSEPKLYNINKTHVYFGGISNFYHEFLTDDKFNGAMSYWEYDDNNKMFIIKIK